MFDDWIRFWNFHVDWDVNFLVMGNVDFFVVWHWDWNLLDDGQSLFLMMMVVWLVMSDFMMSEVLAAVAVTTEVMSTEVMTTEIMIVQASLVLLFARFSLNGLLLILSLFLRGNAQKH